MNKIFKPVILIFRIIYKLIDTLIVTPISRVIYRINEMFHNNSGKIERILNRPNVLLYISLFCAIALFVLIDRKAIDFASDEAEILSDQIVNVIYNEEAYVVEGVPKTVDITLIGKKNSLYLAKQLGEHEVVLDLSGYGVGTYKVKLKYNHSIDSVDYKIDNAVLNVKISEKVSDVRTLTYDLLNEDKLDSKLSIKSVELDRSEIIIKGSQDTIDRVAKVKALVDLEAAKLSEKGTFTVDSIMLSAYGADGEKIENVEIVPAKISASVTVDSYYVELPVKVVATGSLTSGYALSSATSSVTKVGVYGDESSLKNVSYVEARVDVSKITSDKEVAVTLTKPVGARKLTETSTNINIKLDTEASKEFEGIQIESINLGNGYSVVAVSETDRTIGVIAKGVQSVLDTIDAASIKAYIDLSGYGVGTYDVPVNVTNDDVRINLSSKTTTIKVKIVERS